MNFQIISTRAEFQELLEGAINVAIEKKFKLIQSHNIQSEQPVSTKEICAFLGVTEPTIIRWRSKGKIPFLRIGSRILYQKSNVLAALQNKKGAIKL